MEHLIFKYLNDELSQDEWEELRAWLNKSSSNRTALNKLQAYSSIEKNELEEMRELIWNELQLQEDLSHNDAAKRNRVNLTFFLKVAAVLVLVSMVSFFVYDYNKQSQSEQIGEIAMVHKVAPSGMKKITRLPDNSKVILNSGSTISFPEKFEADSRVVTLSGEAYFEIEHDPTKPFLVKFGGDVVRVLGTSFNIRTYPDDDHTYVSVATGKVSFTSSTGDHAVLKPEQMVTFNKEEKKMTIGLVDRTQSFGWKNKIIYFKNRPFQEIVKELERWYGVSIQVDRDYSDIGTFSGEFNDSTLEEVLTGLSFVYRFDFEIKKNNVSLKSL
ncbi:MAG: DUF4974 domain-containing protein [Cyclobacteriaceae bacterium]